MKKICVFGANGKTGLELLRQAQEHNYAIKAAVRRKETLASFNGNLEVVEYTFDRPTSVTKALDGCDVAISVIGSGSYATAAKPTTLYSESAKVLIESLKEAGVNRLIMVSSAGTEHDENSPWYYRAFFRPWLMNSYMDMMKMETIIEESGKDLQWTIVRPTYLLDGKSKLYMVKDRKIGAGNFKINRIDLADFILKESQQDKWVEKHPVLGYKK